MAGRKGSIAAASNSWSFVFVLVVLLIARAPLADPTKFYDLDLRTQSVAAALNGLSEQTGVPVVFPYDLVKDRKANPVVGRYTLLEALDELLKGTGLSGGLSDKGVVTVSLAKSATPTSGETSVPHDENKQHTKKTRLDKRAAIATFFASIAAAFSASAEGSAGAGDAGAGQSLSEVIVTAEKREERALNAPVPVTAITSADLLQKHDVKLVDYVNEVPGLHIFNQAGAYTISMRGISIGTSGSTVGIYVDDVPVGPSTANAYVFLSTPDLDPAEIKQVEVIRGPQGTLYGANAIGGAIKFDTLSPSLSGGFSGKVQVDGSVVDHGGNGGGARLLVTGPISQDVLGFSLAANVRRDPGYIDNVAPRGKSNENSLDANGAHLKFLWKPAEKLSAEFSVLDRNSNAEGNADEDLNSNLTPLYGDLKQARYINEELYAHQQIYSAKLQYELPWAQITSVTSYAHLRSIWQWDETPTFGSFGGPGVGSALRADVWQGKETQELRIQSSGNNQISWLGGFFFTHESDAVNYNIPFYFAQTGAPDGSFASGFLDTRYTEYAGFGDITYSPIDAFSVTAGLRWSTNEQRFWISPDVTTSNDSSLTFLVTPKYEIDDDNMVYSRIASGYQPGGASGISTAGYLAGFPKTYAPDKVVSYEIGYKGQWLDQHLTWALSAFDIEWAQIQLNILINGFAGLGNGGTARSRGFEWETTWKPIRGLSINANVAYIDAYLTADAPEVGGASGDPLPYTTKWAGHISADYNWQVSDSLVGGVGGTFDYQGAQPQAYATGTPAGYTVPILPSYHTVDLRASLSHGNTTGEVFIKNVADSRALTSERSMALDSFSAPLTATVIQPRTVGISLIQRF